MGQALIVSKILFVCLCSGSRGGQQRKYSGSESFIPQKRGFRCTSGGRRTSKENLHVVSISLVRVTALSSPEPLCFIHLSACMHYNFHLVLIPSSICMCAFLLLIQKCLNIYVCFYVCFVILKFILNMNRSFNMFNVCHTMP